MTRSCAGERGGAKAAPPQRNRPCGARDSARSTKGSGRARGRGRANRPPELGSRAWDRWRRPARAHWAPSRIVRASSRGIHYGDGGIDRTDPDLPRGGGRVERGAGERVAKLDEGLGDGCGQLRATLGGLEAALAAYEEPIAQHLAKTRERRARRRLREPKPPAGGGNAPLDPDGFEGNEQIEVEAREARTGAGASVERFKKGGHRCHLRGEVVGALVGPVESHGRVAF